MKQIPEQCTTPGATSLSLLHATDATTMLFRTNGH
jgi:hypothetical protein